MKFTFIYPHKEINEESLFNDTLTTLEYLSLRFTKYLIFMGYNVTIYSKNNIDDNITCDNLIVIDSLDCLNIKAKNKYSWISSSIDNISQRNNAINIINNNVKIITYNELGGDLEIPYPTMDIDIIDMEKENYNYHNENPYAIITTNPKHGLQDIIDMWDNSFSDLYIISKCLQSEPDIIKIPYNLNNVKIINPKNCNHIAMIIKNSRFHISPQLPDTVFNSFAIIAQYYGVPTLSYNYKYDSILHKNNMGGINVKNESNLNYYIKEFSHNDSMIIELSKQATILRSNIDMEKIFIILLDYLKNIDMLA